MLEPNRKQIRKELDEARRMMGFEEQRYGRAFAATLERAARCLYWLHDSEAREYLLRTIESYGQNRQMIGNFYRMLGEQELSRRHFGQAFGGFKERLNEDDFMSVAATAEAAFLAGDYEEAERLADRYRELDPDPGLRIHAVGKLARARRTGDLRVSEEAAEELAEMIRKSRAKVSDTGNVNLWDWYELALETGVQSERGEGPAAVADEVGGVVRRGNAAGTGGPDLQERDLRGKDLRGVNLARANLKGADLRLQSLDEADLSGADLSRADLSDTDLSLAVLVDANLSDANLSRTELIETNFRGAILKGARLAGAECQDPNFSEADLSGADLSGLDLRGADFGRANLREANLSGADLRHADLSGADLTGADLRGVDLDEADITDAVMQGVVR